MTYKPSSMLDSQQDKPSGDIKGLATKLADVNLGSEKIVPGISSEKRDLDIDTFHGILKLLSDKNPKLKKDSLTRVVENMMTLLDRETGSTTLTKDSSSNRIKNNDSISEYFIKEFPENFRNTFDWQFCIERLSEPKSELIDLESSYSNFERWDTQIQIFLRSLSIPNFLNDGAWTQKIDQKYKEAYEVLHSNLKLCLLRSVPIQRDYEDRYDVFAIYSDLKDLWSQNYVNNAFNQILVLQQRIAAYHYIILNSHYTLGKKCILECLNDIQDLTIEIDHLFDKFPSDKVKFSNLVGVMLTAPLLRSFVNESGAPEASDLETVSYPSISRLKQILSYRSGTEIEDNALEFQTVVKQLLIEKDIPSNSIGAFDPKRRKRNRNRKKRSRTVQLVDTITASSPLALSDKNSETCSCSNCLAKTVPVLARDCPMKGDTPQMNNECEQSVDGYFMSSDNDDIEHSRWYLHSGASDYVCNNANLFSSLTFHYKSDSFIELHNGKSVVSGRGTVNLLFSPPGSKPFTLTLKDVAFVPTSARNLVSQARLCEDTDICLVSKNQNVCASNIPGIEGTNLFASIVERGIYRMYCTTEVCLKDISTLCKLPHLNHQSPTC